VSRVPIRLRVTLAFAGAMAVLLAALGLFIYLRFESNLDETVDQGLESRSGEVSAVLQQSTGGSPSAEELLVQREESFAQVLTTDGRIFASTPQLGDRPLIGGETIERAADVPTTVERTEIAGVEEPARLLAAPVTAQGEELIVIVGSTLDDRDESLANLATLLLIGGPAALLLASLAGYAATSAALRPVEAMRRRAAAISAAEPDERLPVPAAEDELSRLGETLNQMLARLQETLERERRFVDDASHELRTPLSLHKTELELALRYGKDSEELRRAIASAIEESDRLIQLAEDLLVVARSEKGKLELELAPLELRPLFDDLRERFRARLEESGRTLLIDAADGTRVEGDRLRLEQALTNMIENALRYGGGEIGLRVTADNGRLELHVTDRGPGFPPGFIDQAFERFSRADPARGRGGIGLGLAIVDGIARSHGGRAGAANLSGGGADVWIELPSDGPRGT
jgi:two-component system, OmpR family, sensor kinase